MSRGSLSDWCDVDPAACKSKTKCRLPLYMVQHAYINWICSFENILVWFPIKISPPHEETYLN